MLRLPGDKSPGYCRMFLRNNREANVSEAGQKNLTEHGDVIRSWALVMGKTESER